MNGSLNLRSLFAPGNIRTLAGPLLIILILSMMVLPLPAFVLDLMFTFNIAVSVMVMLVAMYTRKPLDFSVFPTVLLVTTLLRLSLNVASTRVVLLEGHSGPDAAGKVIEAFGHFVIQGNYVVGAVVFVILVVINFVVITKGAGRIAEVSARFTLDALPGKQMAIDAELNAGIIDEGPGVRGQGVGVELVGAHQLGRLGDLGARVAGEATGGRRHEEDALEDGSQVGVAHRRSVPSAWRRKGACRAAREGDARWSVREEGRPRGCTNEPRGHHGRRTGGLARSAWCQSGIFVETTSLHGPGSSLAFSQRSR